VFAVFVLAGIQDIIQEYWWIDRADPQRRCEAAVSNVVDLSNYSTKATPVFWHVPKAGGTTVHDLVAQCLNLTVAAELGVLGGHKKDSSLKTINVDGRNYVNIDTTTIPGILRAKQLGFANLQPADIVITLYAQETTKLLFAPEHPATLFTLLRHPVDRATSMFYYLQHARWEKEYYHPEWANLTMLEFARSNFAEHNWMVSFLVGKSYVTEDDMKEAKAVLSKMYVGFSDKMKVSLQRFGKAFGWTKHKDWDKCMASFVDHGSNRNNHPHVNKDSLEWRELVQINKLDMELFNFAEQLFEEQAIFQ
jgi:hypothetical protein